MLNWYVVILQKVFLGTGTIAPEQAYEKAEFWSPVLASSTALILIVLLSFISGFYRLKPEKMTDEELLPPKHFGPLAFLEMAWKVVASTLESVLGDQTWLRYVPVLGALFFILIISNLSGVIPGFEPATASMSFDFAVALVIFIIANFVGLKEAGWKYISHLAGPVIWIAPLMFLIELSSLLSRPISLSLRVFGNVSGDHFVFNIFSDLVEKMHVPFLPVPAIFLAFGSFVACLQAFIFMTLSAVYIRLAIDSKEDHH